MKTKTYLLVYSQLGLGGVETLIVRMANWLVSDGYGVKLLLMNESKLDLLLDKRVEVKYYGIKYFFLFDPILIKFFTRTFFFQNIDVIYSFEATTCWLSTIIHQNLKNKPLFYTGVYHPEEYNSYSRGQNGFFKKMIISYIPKDAIFFMNSGCKLRVASNLNMSFEESKYFPLPVNIRPIRLPSECKPENFRILSVGRLVDFKSYNFLMLNVIQNIKMDYENVVFEIYGHGPQQSKLIKEIEHRSLTNNVIFKGALNYEKFSEVLDGAYLYIGMGTTLVEASMCGVPSLVAKYGNQLSTCYGFFHNQRDLNVGEINPENREYDLELIIREAFSWTNEEYLTEVMKSTDYCEKFNMDSVMREFLKNTWQLQTKEIRYPSARWQFSYFIRYVLYVQSSLFLKWLPGKITEVTSKCSYKIVSKFHSIL